jgi:hypothetical protein
MNRNILAITFERRGGWTRPDMTEEWP